MCSSLDLVARRPLKGSGVWVRDALSSTIGEVGTGVEATGGLLDGRGAEALTACANPQAP